MSKLKDTPKIPIDLSPFSSSSSSSSSTTTSKETSFLTPNNLNSNPRFEFSDIEMFSLQSLTYTSLKDILPANISPTPINTPTKNSTIPIKNPLVKQAALAYLQPMSLPLESENRGLFGNFKEMCCCGFLGEIVRMIKRASKTEEGESDSESDVEEEEDDKVD